jgi:hypothetical protein
MVFFLNNFGILLAGDSVFLREEGFLVGVFLPGLVKV